MRRTRGPGPSRRIHSCDDCSGSRSASDDDPPRPDREFRPPRRLSLNEAAAAVPFTVLIPSPAPGRMSPDVTMDHDDDDHIDGPTLTIVYIAQENGRQRGNVWITLSAAPLPSLRFDTWRSAMGMSVSEDRSGGYYRCKLRLERAGTHVQVESSAHRTLDEVVAVAESLTPVSDL